MLQLKARLVFFTYMMKQWDSKAFNFQRDLNSTFLKLKVLRILIVTRMRIMKQVTKNHLVTGDVKLSVRVWIDVVEGLAGPIRKLHVSQACSNILLGYLYSFIWLFGFIIVCIYWSCHSSLLCEEIVQMSNNTP